MEMRKIITLTINHDNDEIKDIEKCIEILLNNKQDNKNVIINPNQKDYINKIRKLINKRRPDIIFVDKSFGSEGLQEMGAKIISELFADDIYPDIISILITRHDIIRVNSLSKFVPNPDIIINKSKILTEEGKNPIYTEYIRKIINSRIKKTIIHEFLTVDNDNKVVALDDAFKSLRKRGGRGKLGQISSEEIRSILEQSCYNNKYVLEEDSYVKNIRLKKRRGGHSGAIIFEMSIDTKYGNYNTSHIIKFMHRSAYNREIKNHSEFVKWVLPYKWRVDILGSGKTKNFGAIIYSFAHGEGINNAYNIETLEDVYKKCQPIDARNKTGEQKTEIRRLVSVMNSVFHPDKQAWYSNRRKSEKNLGIYLTSEEPLYGMDDDHANNIIKQVCKMYIDKEYIHDIGDGFIISIPNKVNVKFRGNVRNEAAYLYRQNTCLCLSHGDMHFGNIILRKGTEEFCFIDFSNTGYRVRTRDFCSFESSLRIGREQHEVISNHLLFSKIFNEERAMWLKNSNRFIRRNSYKWIVLELRKLYLKNHDSTKVPQEMPHAGMKEYALASLFHTWWMLGFNVKHKEKTGAEYWKNDQVISLLGFFFATLEYLRNGNRR